MCVCVLVLVLVVCDITFLILINGVNIKICCVDILIVRATNMHQIQFINLYYGIELPGRHFKVAKLYKTNLHF